MKIAICDDNPEDIEKLEKILDTLLDRNSQYDVFTSSQELLEYKEKNSEEYNLYILDIEMKNMSGLGLAQRIRETDVRALIVFLTGFSNYVYEVFEVVTFDFILKPVNEEKIKNMFDKVTNYLNLTKKLFCFSYRQNKYSIFCDEILYIEKNGRQATIHTRLQAYKANLKLDEIMRQTDPNVFAQINGSVIVNLEYIVSIQRDELQFTGGTTFYISRVYKSALKEKHLNYIKGKL